MLHKKMLYKYLGWWFSLEQTQSQFQKQNFFSTSEQVPSRHGVYAVDPSLEWL